jgi:O-antigen ligase
MKKGISGLKIFLISTLILGIIVIYKTYVRTGYICLILGGGYLILWRKKFSYYIKMIPIILLFLGGIGFKIMTDPVLILKITDQRANGQRKTSDQIGSGRGLLWKMAVKNWQESPPINMLLGNGMMKSYALMATTKVGAPLASHNGYLDILQHTGLVGLSLFVFYLSVIFRYAQRARDALIKKRLTALFILLVVSFFFQGGHFFWVDCLIAFTLAKCIIEKREISEKKLEENTLALDN